MEYGYIITINQRDDDGEQDRALAGNEIERLLLDHIQKHPHYEEYGTIEITVEGT